MAAPVVHERPGAAYKPVVRVVAALLAVGAVVLYSMCKTPNELLPGGGGVANPGAEASKANKRVDLGVKVDSKTWTTRHLLGSPAYGDDGDDYDEGGGLVGDDGDGDDNTTCSSPRRWHKDFNNSCDYVLERCGDSVQLFNYLKLILCNLTHHTQWIGYVILILWLLYLISLLATTADNFFVPPLNLLSEKLRLSPSIAGITLLAIGNGAPDVFTAYAGLKQDDIRLVLGALIGASIFISTVVLGTIILVVEVRSEDIDKIDFVRDVVAYLLVVVLVVGVAYDGTVHLYEAILFLVFYIAYISVAVLISFVRGYLKKRHEARIVSTESDPFLNPPPIRNTMIQEVKASMSGEEIVIKPKLQLLGLTWPKGAHIGTKIQFVIEWPMSVFRWISIPPCYYDDQWTRWHYMFVVVSPVPMVMVMLVACAGWSGLYGIWMGKLPLLVFLVLCGIAMSAFFFFVLSSNRPPHWSLQIVLGTLAFVMSIAWLNIEANEVVSVLNSIGLLFNIDTGILGLTVLAIGNSVGDWVADTAVARAGKPGMGIASCFGSPLLNDVLGLSLALIARIGFYEKGKPYTFDIHDTHFLKVKMSWIFLGISLVSSIVIIPLFRFSPPKPFGVALLYLYVVFMVFSILNVTGHFNIDFLEGS